MSGNSTPEEYLDLRRENLLLFRIILPEPFTEFYIMIKNSVVFDIYISLSQRGLPLKGSFIISSGVYLLLGTSRNISTSSEVVLTVRCSVLLFFPLPVWHYLISSFIFRSISHPF
jgi:hypothetical protein